LEYENRKDNVLLSLNEGGQIRANTARGVQNKEAANCRKNIREILPLSVVVAAERGRTYTLPYIYDSERR
jgi:hypothetical protein